MTWSGPDHCKNKHLETTSKTISDFKSISKTWKRSDEKRKVCSTCKYWPKLMLILCNFNELASEISSKSPKIGWVFSWIGKLYLNFLNSKLFLFAPIFQFNCKQTDWMQGCRSSLRKLCFQVGFWLKLGKPRTF